MSWDCSGCSDIWATAKPFMQRWMARQVGPEAAIERFAERLPDLLRQLPRLPALLVDADFELKRLSALTAQQTRRLDELSATVERRGGRGRLRSAAAIVLIAGSGALLWRPLTDAMAGGQPLVTSVGLMSLVLGSMLLLRS